MARFSIPFGGLRKWNISTNNPCWSFVIVSNKIEVLGVNYKVKYCVKLKYVLCLFISFLPFTMMKIIGKL